MLERLEYQASAQLRGGRPAGLSGMPRRRDGGVDRVWVSGTVHGGSHVSGRGATQFVTHWSGRTWAAWSS